MTAVILLSAAVGLGGLLARPAAADGVPWTVETAANHFGADRQDYRYTLDPGGRLGDGVLIANRGAIPLRLAVRATGLGAWVHPDRDAVTVPPGESVEVPFALALPADAAPGDHVGGIVTSADDGRQVAIPIRLRVGGPLKPSLSVERVRVNYADTPDPLGKGDATVTYAIRNTGNVILTARQTVAVSGPFGRWAAAAGKLADSPALLPGATWKVSVPLRGVAPAIRTTATVTLVPLLTDAAGSIAPLSATTTSGHAWTVPWTLLLAVIVLCALVSRLRPPHGRRARRSRGLAADGRASPAPSPRGR